MPRRTVLSTSQRASFEALPVEPVELARHYTLGEADLTLIRKRRRASNRIGFAVQLCLSRYPGRTLRAGPVLSRFRPQPGRSRHYSLEHSLS